MDSTASHARNWPHSSRLTLDLGSPGLQPPTLETNSAHLWTNTSLRTPRDFTGINLMTQLHPPEASNLLTRPGLAAGLGGSHADQTSAVGSLPSQQGPCSPHRGHR